MKHKWACIAGFLLTASGAHMLSAQQDTLKTVPAVDLSRYQGTWYEIGRLPLYWERNCVADVTATYTLLPNHKIQVVNRCRKADGSELVSKGTAIVADKNSPASKLKVTFFWPFAGDYWIIDLDPDYRWAIVGTPSRENLWLLSRTPKIDVTLLQQLLAAAKAKGFDTGRMLYARQGN